MMNDNIMQNTKDKVWLIGKQNVVCNVSVMKRQYFINTFA